MNEELRKKLKKELAGRFLDDDRLGNFANKKENEIQIIKGFVNRLCGKKNWSIHPTEAPDSVLEIKGFKIGLELTYFFSDNAHKGSKGNELFERWRKIAKRLSIKLKKEHLSFWYGAIHFVTPFDKNLAKLDEKIFIEAVVELVKPKLQNTKKKI